MMSLRRFAAFGLLDPLTAATIRPLQERLAAATGNDRALRFPVHVTLRGRFWGDPVQVRDAFEEAALPGAARIALRLNGPVFRHPDLLWLAAQAVPGPCGLTWLHEVLAAALAQAVVRDETASGHAGAGYRPHITLGWGATEETLQSGAEEILPVDIHADVVAVVLGIYPDSWPDSGRVYVAEAWPPLQ